MVFVTFSIQSEVLSQQRESWRPVPDGSRLSHLRAVFPRRCVLRQPGLSVAETNRRCGGSSIHVFSVFSYRSSQWRCSLWQGTVLFRIAFSGAVAIGCWKPVDASRAAAGAAVHPQIT